MNPLFDFNAKEIGLIQMAILAVAQSTQHTIDQGIEPPDGFIECLESVVKKMNLVIEARIENDNRFESLVESQLSDVDDRASQVISNPDLPINEYN